MRSESDEQRLETVNQVVNRIKHVLERFEDRLTLDNLKLVERYLKGELQVLVLYKLSRKHGEHIACFERLPSVVGGRNVVGVLRANAFKEGADCDQEAVLVDIVESMEPPKGVIPSLVRSASVDSFFSRLRHSLYFSGRFGHVFRGVVRDREIGSFENPIIPRPVQPSKLKSEMIQCAPEISEGVSGDKGYEGRNRSSATEPIDHEIRSLRVRLSSSEIWVEVEEGAKRDIKILDVLFGPFDFRPD